MAESTVAEEMPYVAELLLSVPRGFEPEAASEMAELTGMDVATIAAYPSYGLLRLPVMGSLDTLLDACCHSLSLLAAYAYLGRWGTALCFPRCTHGGTACGAATAAVNLCTHAQPWGHLPHTSGAFARVMHSAPTSSTPTAHARSAASR
jgi:hypothetical protein